jgi:hypothetical protein
MIEICTAKNIAINNPHMSFDKKSIENKKFLEFSLLDMNH